MADGYSYAILRAFQTIFRANIKTEKDAIDSSLPDVDSNAIIIEKPTLLVQRYPWIHISPVFGATNVNLESSNTCITPEWEIITSIQITANTGVELINELDIWLKVMIKTIVKGSTGEQWSLNGTATLLKLLSITFGLPDDSDVASDIHDGAFLTWLITNVEDPTT